MPARSQVASRDVAARARAVLRALKKKYPNARCELDFADPWQLIVSVCLSAQTTDVHVNKVTPALFAAFPTPQSLARVSAAQVEPYIQSLGLFRNKARNLVLMARDVVEKHQGRVPSDRESLEALAGVGRKTANVVLSNAFQVPALAVDTHVGRVARRLGLTRHEDPEKVERDLCALWPESEWTQAHHTLIFHGRRTCHARRPQCQACAVTALCPKVGL